MPRTAKTKKLQGRYDIRQAAAAFAPIVGTFGAIAVTAIVVLFTVPPKVPVNHAPYIAMAAGLLILAMINSFTGSFALASIGAEEDLTANLVPAVMYIMIPVMISLVGMLGAFEVLAAIYLPESKTLFALITAAAGLIGSITDAFGVSDSLHSGPVDTTERSQWIHTQWIQTRVDAHKWTNRVIMACIVPPILGAFLRLLGVEAIPTTFSSNWLVGIGFIVSMVGLLAGYLRSRHSVEEFQRGLRKCEGFTAPLAIGLYTFGLLIFLP
jgi:uncharacterized membrane protein YqjE